MRVEQGQLNVQRGIPDCPDAPLTGDLALLGGLCFGSLRLADAEAAGSVIEGDRPWVQRFPTLFQMPEVVCQP